MQYILRNSILYTGTYSQTGTPKDNNIQDWFTLSPWFKKNILKCEKLMIEDDRCHLMAKVYMSYVS